MSIRTQLLTFDVVVLVICSETFDAVDITVSPLAASGDVLLTFFGGIDASVASKPDPPLDFSCDVLSDSPVVSGDILSDSSVVSGDVLSVFAVASASFTASKF